MKKRRTVTLILLFGLLLCLSACGNDNAETEPPLHEGTFDVYLIHDVRYLGETGNNEDWNDLVRFYTSLQGRLNKKAKWNGFFVYQMFDSTDQFWFDYITGDGKMLADSKIVDLNSWDDLWNAFNSYISDAGIVVWDPSVPATANVAATICSVDGYLPVRYDTDADSLYTWLLNHDVAIKQNLCNLFDGNKDANIADTDIPSTGSIKCDPYLWAMEKYMDRTNASMLAYVLDGASQIASNPIYQKAESTDPCYNQLYSHDYYIYNECFFIDLTCIRSETPCDDPDQKKGTDRSTLATILERMSERNNGKMCRFMGFPPWYMKYTTHLNNGSIEPVELEWAFSSFISSYNFIKEADAAHPSWMTNASVYCQYESTLENYENSKVDVTEVFDEKVRYFTIYIGDYDSSAWLKEMAPGCFESDARGELPLMWAFNPNLSDRVPMIFDYVYENKTDKDFFITGDTGAGYVMPTYVKDLTPWIEFSQSYMEKFDMDIVGFIIDRRSLTERELAAYAKLSPLGAFHNDGSRVLDIYNDQTVFMRMQDVYPDTEGWEKWMYDCFLNGHSNFASFRTIRQQTDNLVDSIKAFEAYANAKNDGYTYKYVDMYTLFDLILQSGQGRYIYGE